MWLQCPLIRLAWERKKRTRERAEVGWDKRREEKEKKAQKVSLHFYPMFLYLSHNGEHISISHNGEHISISHNGEHISISHNGERVSISQWRTCFYISQWRTYFYISQWRTCFYISQWRTYFYISQWRTYFYISQRRACFYFSQWRTCADWKVPNPFTVQWGHHSSLLAGFDNTVTFSMGHCEKELCIFSLKEETEHKGPVIWVNFPSRSLSSSLQYAIQ
jgi:hypothetical protein